MRSLLLWLFGVPIFVIILLNIFHIIQSHGKYIASNKPCSENIWQMVVPSFVVAYTGYYWANYRYCAYDERDFCRWLVCCLLFLAILWNRAECGDTANWNFGDNADYFAHHHNNYMFAQTTQYAANDS